MAKNIDDADKSELINLVGRLQSLLDNYIVPQNGPTGNGSEDFQIDILNVLKEENEVITNCKKIKQIFRHTVCIRNEIPLDARSGTEMISSLSNSKDEPTCNVSAVLPSEHVQEHSSSDNVSAGDGHCKSTKDYETEHIQESKDDEDILDLMASQSDFVYDDLPVVVASTSSAAEDLEFSVEKDYVQRESNDINTRNSFKRNHSSQIKDNQVNDVRFCFTYLKTKTCKNHNCEYVHKFPNTDEMNNVLKKLYTKTILELAKSTRLRKKYGDCFAKIFSKKKFTRELIDITIEFLCFQEQYITNSIVYTTLDYFVNNKVVLTKYKDLLLTNIRSEEPACLVLFEKELRRKIKSEDDFDSFKYICILFADFITANFTELNVSITEKLINKISSIPYDPHLTKALLDMMRCTNADIFEKSAIYDLENYIRSDEDIFKKYLMLKKETTKKKTNNVENNYVTRDPSTNTGEVSSSTFKDRKLQNYSNILSIESIQRNGIDSLYSCDSDQQVSPDSSRADEKTDAMRNTTQEIHTNNDVTACDDTRKRSDTEYTNFNPSQFETVNTSSSKKRYHSRHRICCLYNITGHCNRSDCSYPHKLPEVDDFKFQLMQTHELRLFALINHQETVQRYGKCLAETFYERKLIKQLLKLAVKCLRLSNIIPDIKSKVIDITLTYFNNVEINVNDCEDLLNQQIQMQSVHWLLLEELLSNEALVTLSKAFFFLTDFISANYVTFSNSIADTVLNKVCSSYDPNLAKAFLKIIPLTHPKILKHSLIPRFEELIAANEDIYEEYKVLKITKNDCNGNSDQTTKFVDKAAETSSVIEDIDSHSSMNTFGTSNPEVESANKETSTSPISVNSRAHQPEDSLDVEVPDQFCVNVQAVHKKNKDVTIYPCTWWANLVKPPTSNSNIVQANDQAEPS